MLRKVVWDDFGGCIRVKKVWVGSTVLQIRLWGPKKKRTGVSDLLNDLKCSWSYSEALQTLVILLAVWVGSYDQKLTKKLVGPPSGLLFSSQIQFSCQYFGLKFGGML